MTTNPGWLTPTKEREVIEATLEAKRAADAAWTAELEWIVYALPPMADLEGCVPEEWFERHWAAVERIEAEKEPKQ